MIKSLAIPFVVFAALSMMAPQLAVGQGATIQLPTMTFFNIRTAVSVPDGGSMHLGGIRRGASATSRRGVPILANSPLLNRGFANRGIGSNVSGGLATAQVQIIDMKEMEARVIQDGERRSALHSDSNPNGSAKTRRTADFLSRNIGRNK